jgi:hypothetical protein
MEIGEERDAGLELDGHTPQNPNEFKVVIRNAGSLGIRKFVQYLSTSGFLWLYRDAGNALWVGGSSCRQSHESFRYSCGRCLRDYIICLVNCELVLQAGSNVTCAMQSWEIVRTKDFWGSGAGVGSFGLVTRRCAECGWWEAILVCQLFCCMIFWSSFNVLSMLRPPRSSDTAWGYA